MRYKLIRLISVTLVLATGLFSEAASPNIVCILADDMGYGDVHALNPDSKIPTPNLDRLASEGMKFTDAHTPSAVCTPTRYGLLTGRYCWRSRLKRGVLNGYSTPLIETERATIASLLKSHGYTTAIVGKWHLGLGFAKANDGNTFDFEKPVAHGPKELGFDFSYVIPASLDFPPYVFVRDGAITELPTLTQDSQKFPAFLRKGPRSPDFVMDECLDHLVGQATGFLKTHASDAQSKPFFLYFPLTAPHKPVLPHSRFQEKTKLGPYGDFVFQVDWTVGQVMKALEEYKLAENTIVIYTSDNGSFMYRTDNPNESDHVDDKTQQRYKSSNHKANYVFRGTKADIWEAGHHVPFFVRWPSKVEQGSKCDQTICLTDIMATAADVTEAKLPDGAAPDSFSFLPLLQGKAPKETRPAVIHHSSGGMFAIREGKWKLVLGNGSGGREKPSGKPFQKPYALFDLSKDISEQKNVAEEFSEVAARLEQKYEEIRASE